MHLVKLGMKEGFF